MRPRVGARAVYVRVSKGGVVAIAECYTTAIQSCRAMHQRCAEILIWRHSECVTVVCCASQVWFFAFADADRPGFQLLTPNHTHYLCIRRERGSDQRPATSEGTARGTQRTGQSVQSPRGVSVSAFAFEAQPHTAAQLTDTQADGVYCTQCIHV